MSRLNLLVVEDEPDTRDLLVQLLEMEGYSISSAGTIETAKQRLQAHGPFDVLLVDIDLPDGDGRDLLPIGRAFHPQLIGIAMSGYSGEAHVQRTIGAGFLRHYVKPVAIWEVLVLLSQLGAAKPSV